MINKFCGVAALALLAVVPASAQILGGAPVGGLGGSLGGLGGSGIGSVGRTIDRAPRADTATRATRNVRADRRVRARDGAVDASGAIAGSSTLSNQSRVAGRSISGESAVSGSADGGVNLRALPTRGVVAATRRGLRPVARTASGVPVFVSRVGVAVPAVSAPAYPVYNRSIYYGGPDAVYLAAADVRPYMDRQYRDLQRGVAGTGASVIRRGDDLVVMLPGDVTFAFDKSDIRPRFAATLQAVADTLETYRGTDVEIVGHTDSVGSDQYNLALSERRGRSVADFLVEENTDPSRLVVEAMGESEPAATNASVQGRSANRRVEIILHPRMG